ncbi:MAG: LEA type 2 family protein [Phycisphaerales bacterium]|nr:LEA type 2 family protein [Phycisphaerales bacterium]
MLISSTECIRRLFAASFALGALALGGCSGYSSPRFSVASAEVVERTETGVVVLLTIDATNENDVPLPLREIEYEMDVGGRRVFSGVRSPEATLRSNGVQQFTIPAAIAIEPGRGLPTGVGEFRLSGSVTYLTPGALAETLFDAGVRQPEASFSDTGTVDWDGGQTEK